MTQAFVSSLKTEDGMKRASIVNISSIVGKVCIEFFQSGSLKIYIFQQCMFYRVVTLVRQIMLRPKLA